MEVAVVDYFSDFVLISTAGWLTEEMNSYEVNYAINEVLQAHRYPRYPNEMNSYEVNYAIN